MRKKIVNFLNERRQRRNSSKINKRIILLNAAGFSLVLFLSLEENHLYVQILLFIYILTNCFLFLFWKKIQKDLDLLIFSLNAFISFVTSFDFYSNGSRYVYIIYFLIGLFFFTQALLKAFKKVPEGIRKI